MFYYSPKRFFDLLWHKCVEAGVISLQSERMTDQTARSDAFGCNNLMNTRFAALREVVNESYGFTSELLV